MGLGAAALCEQNKRGPYTPPPRFHHHFQTHTLKKKHLNPINTSKVKINILIMCLKRVRQRQQQQAAALLQGYFATTSYSFRPKTQIAEENCVCLLAIRLHVAQKTERQKITSDKHSELRTSLLRLTETCEKNQLFQSRFSWEM